MTPLFTEEQFKIAKTYEKLTVLCINCNNTFTLSKKRIKDILNPNLSKTGDFCSKICQNKNQETKQTVNCSNCAISFKKLLCEIKKSRSGNHFCSKSCSATYNNKNKTHGTRRSKLEVWLEEQLPIIYPNLDFHFNRKDAIGSELDIYIPSLNLAFELNGIFHYEPIYGPKTLDRVQNNDISKSKACHEAKIDLCVIDVSRHTYVKPATSKKYLGIIINIIKERY